LTSTAIGPMMEAWFVRDHSFRSCCEDAVGLRAGALHAVPGGRCAERERIVCDTTMPEHVLESTEAVLVLLRAVEAATVAVDAIDNARRDLVAAAERDGDSGDLPAMFASAIIDGSDVFAGIGLTAKSGEWVDRDGALIAANELVELVNRLSTESVTA
jgi:hypothetical protein